MKAFLSSSFLYTVAVVLLLCIHLWCPRPVTASSSMHMLQNETTDRLSLIAFKAGITHDPLGMLSSWNNDSQLHYCRWWGVHCSRRHVHRVTGLILFSYGLVGTLSPHIGNLTFLRTLLLQNNSFHGKVSSEVGGLFRLEVLILSNNSFEGNVPTNLTYCSELRVLNLINNKLDGEIPEQLGSLSKLKRLGFSLNNLKGKIPASLGNLSSLSMLSASHNNLEGSIPEELGRRTSIDFMQLGFNRLTGTIPSSLYNLSNMRAFGLAANQLEGSLSQYMDVAFPNLWYLDLAINRFTGPIPVSLSNFSMLEYIFLHNNSFTGQVPPTLGRLQSLREINVAINQLGSSRGDDLSFIDSLANCTQLQVVDIQLNFLKGPLVSTIANFSTRISRINLGANQIHGTIPLGIENLVNLTFLNLAWNRLAGRIPCNIGKLYKMQQLGLHANRLSGRIPSSLGNLTILNVLDLSSNNLMGNIPSSLAACQRLVRLHLSNNNLNGSIPNDVMGLSSLVVLLFGGNEFTGSLPLEVGHMINLEVLDISECRLSGGLPNTLGNCVGMQDLRLGGNVFEGEIPTSLQTLRGLERLDLSRNKFYGKFPMFLGDLPFLNYLNLSFNELEGEVPSSVKANVTISVEGNNNLCGGLPKLHLPTCVTSSSGKKRQRPSAKLLVPVIIGISFLSLLAFFFIIRLRRKKIRNINASSAQSFNGQFLRISFADLHKATEGFSEANKIGVGRYGSVYKGVLDDKDGTAIAVKVFDLPRRGASKSFMSECKALRKIRHRNLVQVLSACSSLDYQGNDFKALAFELMPQGNLDRWLHPQEVRQDEPQRLTFLQRLNIAIDIASALEYLHTQCDEIIVHNDIKPSNVLLDKDLMGHISDFGIAKIFSVVSNSMIGTDQNSSNTIKGSIGYIAPEYAVRGQVSMEGDMYSYGILLLEMFTGRRPTDREFQDGHTLHNFVKTSLPERVMEVIDQPLLFEGDERGKMKECIIGVLEIGIICLMESPKDRMEIHDASNKLRSIRSIFLREAVGPGEGM